MWRVWLFLGGLLWLLTIVSSSAMNAYAGFGLGRTQFESMIFAALGVAADGWKALAPIFIAALVRRRRLMAAGAAAAMWLVCFAFAVTAALGLAAENRNAATGGREAQQAAYQAATREAELLEEARTRRAPTRSAKEVEAAIGAVLARVIPNHGTVSAISAGCTKDAWRAEKACAEVATLRIELARAVATERDDARLIALQGELARLRTDGAMLEVDAQAHLIARITRGLIAHQDVGLAIILLLVTMIELVSAFAPVVLSEFARSAREEREVMRETASKDVTALEGRTVGEPETGDVYAFMAARLRPQKGSVVPHAAMLAAYRTWCSDARTRSLDREAFERELARVCTTDLRGSIRISAKGYHECELTDAAVPLLLAR